MKHLEYAVSRGGGWVNLGHISEDGITLSSGDDRSCSLTPLSTIHDDLSGSLEMSARCEPILMMFRPNDVFAMKIRCRKSTKASRLREQAESIGGKFLRNYLKSQRRSRANTGAKPYATGGLMKREVIFPRVRLEDDPYHWRTS